MFWTRLAVSSATKAKHTDKRRVPRKTRRIIRRVAFTHGGKNAPHLRHFHHGGRLRSLCGDSQKSRSREKAFEAAGVQIIGRLLPLFNPERHRGTHCPPRLAEAIAKSPHASNCSRAARELAQREDMYESRG